MKNRIRAEENKTIRRDLYGTFIYYSYENANLATIDRDELVDIRDVKVNTSLPKRERAIDFIRQIGNPYCYRHGKYVVKVGFSDTEVSLEERLAGYILSKC